MAAVQEVLIIIAHSGLDRKITQGECESSVQAENVDTIFVEFASPLARLDELYDLPFDNIALAQERQFAKVLAPLLEAHPTAEIAYFGLCPIPVGFHLGYLLGNTRRYTIYHWHHGRAAWYKDTKPPSPEYYFEVVPPALPVEIQKGKGDVVVRLSTSFLIDPKATLEICSNPANEFDIAVLHPHPDALYNQQCIANVVNSFQDVLNTYASKLSDREQIHLFLSCPSGLPFALGTRINPNIYPLIQTYQFSRDRTPKYRAAILISKELDGQIQVSKEDQEIAAQIRFEWEDMLQKKIKPFISTITGKSPIDWLQTISSSDEQYKKLSRHRNSSWGNIIHLGKTSLTNDHIATNVFVVPGGFEYVQLTNTWQLDDGFLSGLKRRLGHSMGTDLAQAARLFFFHESLHYAHEGHRLTRGIADGIGQFPKVIEEADYQADVWALLTEYRYAQIYDVERVNTGPKSFFCSAIDTAVETMWSFLDTGEELSLIQIRSMNRFLNWYWQSIRIEGLAGGGTLEEIASILFEKPVIEFAGAPMTLRAHRTFYRLKGVDDYRLQLGAFLYNRLFRFAPTQIADIVEGFRELNGEKIKEGLRNFYATISSQP